MRPFLLFIVLILMHLAGQTQPGALRGRAYNSLNGEALTGATIRVQGDHPPVFTDSAGRFTISGLLPGLYNIEASFVGFRARTIFEIQVNNLQPTLVDIALDPLPAVLQDIAVHARSEHTLESPLSSQTIGVNEIQRNPGGNRDISKVIQSLPGAGVSVGFRNDLIIRGGGPAENRYYIDGIEIPLINHFATQGASGGPVGIINVDFLKSVNIYSGAFPADKGNLLSSLLDFSFKDGRNDHWTGGVTLGSSDLAIKGEGPVSSHSTLIFSVRRSYLQFLFQLLQLPFLPTYNDFQFKYKLKLPGRSELSILGIGAIDDFTLNNSAKPTELNKYTLNNINSGSQWNYAIGAVLKVYHPKGYSNFILSTNNFNNTNDKYNDNATNDPAALRYRYRSRETETKLRWEEHGRSGWLTFQYGLSGEADHYTNNTYSILWNNTVIDTVIYNTSLSLARYGAYAQLSTDLPGDKLRLSLGGRIDGNTYSSSMTNPFRQVSPRFSVSWSLTPRLSWNANTGIYYELPAYTTLGFKDNEGVLVNKQNNLRYIQAIHYVTGFGYELPFNAHISAEGFYKSYRYYPFSVNNRISLANEGGDYGVVGDEAVTPTGEGRAYGSPIRWCEANSRTQTGIMSLLPGTSAISLTFCWERN